MDITFGKIMEEAKNLDGVLKREFKTTPLEQMRIKEDYAEGYTLENIKILNDGTRNVASLTPTQMWQIYEYMKVKHIRKQIIDYLDLRNDDDEYFEELGRTAEDMLADDGLLDSCVEGINDGSYGDLGEEEIYKLLERYA